jgi:hypothetical protein
MRATARIERGNAKGEEKRLGTLLVFTYAHAIISTRVVVSRKHPFDIRLLHIKNPNLNDEHNWSAYKDSIKWYQTIP